LSTESESLSGLTPVVAWLENLTDTRWQLLPVDAEAGELVTANGQPVARLAALNDTTADTAGAALLGWAADRVLTVKDLTRQSARLWQELAFFHRITVKLDALAAPLEGMPVLLEALVKLLRSRDGWLVASLGRGGEWASGDRPMPPGLAKLATAAQASGGSLSLSRPEHLPEGLAPHEREALLAAMPLLVAPLAAQGELAGFVAVASPMAEGPYTSFSAKLLHTGASLATGLVQRCRMLQAAESAASLRRELEVARRIQQSLRPRQPLERPDVACWGWCREAAIVGGDMYGWWTPETPDAPIWCYIGDVAGHGVGPALLMSNAYAVLRALCREEGDAGRVASRLNALMCEDIEAAMEYLTLSLMRLDPAGRQLHYVGLGHPPVLLWRRGHDAPIWLEGDGMPAGLFASATYQEAIVPLEPGDLLVAYTDGITEAELPDGEPFGQDRLAELIRVHRDAPLPAIGQALIGALGENGDAYPDDDQTLLIMRIGDA
jgi:serine phosphatase RsbU (regulator of sigma subunit)/antitoxin (DNA-binding transcriptional repressor) of toxin-antitoxin stability system